MHVHILAAMAQHMVHQHDRQHRLGYRRGANTHTGVVAAVRGNFGGITCRIDGGAGQADTIRPNRAL